MFPQRDSYFGGSGRFPSYPERKTGVRQVSCGVQIPCTTFHLIRGYRTEDLREQLGVVIGGKKIIALLAEYQATTGGVKDHHLHGVALPLLTEDLCTRHTMRDDLVIHQAARLQLKLMAQQKAEEGLGEPHPDKEERKPVILKEDEKKKQTGGETSKVKEGQKDATSKGTKKSSATGSDDHVSKPNRAEKEAQRSPENQDDKQPRKDEAPPKGDTLVLKKNFEEVHMLGREKAASVAAPYPVKSGEPTLPVVPVGPVPRVPVPRASYDVERTTAVRYPTRLTDFGERKAPVPLGKRAVEREFIEEPDTRRRRPQYYDEEEPRSYPRRGIDREETEVGRRKVQFYDREEPSPRIERDMDREEADAPRRRTHYYEEDEPRLERSMNREGTESPRKRAQYFEENDSRARLERREETEVPKKRPQYYEEEEPRTPVERNMEREETDSPRRRPQYYEEGEPRRRPERNVEREEPAARRRNPLYYDEDEPTSYPERNMAREPPRPKSRTTIDPNQFVEELSDSEDWDQIAEVVNAPRMRSPFDDDLGRPGKTTTFFYVKKKSFFRMEYPSIAPKIYFSGHSKERTREEPVEEKGPVQAHIAPAKPLFGDTGVGVGWRHESAAPLIPEPPARYRPAGGVVSQHGGYFD
ncbi:unnamed protein product [Heligmosomoides polygyrus]|uniref:Doublecortin domain-containing protein n=1 Tax=Heligmosomoides polygyrus TaxID=6339 RepID=A0A3P8AV73_HELPZ|nr:unnamed protein product [Heligmosomoides polygyrus]